MEKQTKTRPFFSCVAASLTILLGMSLFLSSFCVGRAMADTTSGDEAFLVVQDSDGERWTELKELNVFANSEFNGKSIIAPGTEGKYTFTVQNISDFPMEYEIGFEEENLNGVPLEFRLKNSNGYLTNNWTPATELSNIREELANNSKTGYTLEWQWNFEGDDEIDTAIGSNSAEIPYILKIRYTAEQNGEAVSPQTDDRSPQNGDSSSQTDENFQQTDNNSSQADEHSPQTNEHSPKTGDDSNIPFLIALLICSCLTMFLTLLLWRRNDDEENEEA